MTGDGIGICMNLPQLVFPLLIVSCFHCTLLEPCEYLCEFGPPQKGQTRFRRWKWHRSLPCGGTLIRHVEHLPSTEAAWSCESYPPPWSVPFHGAFVNLIHPPPPLCGCWTLPPNQSYQPEREVPKVWWWHDAIFVVTPVNCSSRTYVRDWKLTGPSCSFSFQPWDPGGSAKVMFQNIWGLQAELLPHFGLKVIAPARNKMCLEMIGAWTRAVCDAQHEISMKYNSSRPAALGASLQVGFATALDSSCTWPPSRLHAPFGPSRGMPSTSES